MEKVNDQDSSNPETKFQPKASGGNSNPSSSQQPASGKIDGIKAAKNNIQEQFSSVAINSDHKKLIGLLSLVAIGALVYFLFLAALQLPISKKMTITKR